MGSFGEMMAVFEKLKADGLELNVAIWNTLLSVFGQKELVLEVSGVFKEMKQSGLCPKKKHTIP
jgi:pentatricopeptide repeat protein